MNTCFYTTENETNITRARANGYKHLVIDEKVDAPCMVEIVSEDLDTDAPKLVVKPLYTSAKEPDEYVFLCKSFGMVGYSASFENKVSVIFCDNDYMLVTLHKGMLVLQEDTDTLKVFVVGVKNVPMIEKDNILWKNAKDLMSFIRYMGVKAPFPFDFEFMFELEGGVSVAMENFSLRHIDAEDIDISMGAFAILSESVDTQAIQEVEKNEKIKEKNRRNLDRYFS